MNGDSPERESLRTKETMDRPNLGKFPAFPLPISTALDGSIYSVADQSAGNDCGLTKRELFAAMAMQGLQAINIPSAEIARIAVEQADFLLRELSK